MFKPCGVFRTQKGYGNLQDFTRKFEPVNNLFWTHATYYIGCWIQTWNNEMFRKMRTDTGMKFVKFETTLWLCILL